MCGIAGYVGTSTLDPERIQACLKAMGRRGPDTTGTYHHRQPSGGNVYLLHSRLKIIDLDDRSNQPFRAGTAVISFNGEIYNYVELREAMKASGTSFATTSDTEVLIKALGEQGIPALDTCEGMWAFAYYDERTGALLLSRDRFGEKPLYIHRADGGLYFGSEVKLIRNLSGRTPTVNERQILRYLVNGYKSLYKEKETFFLGIEELAPGTALSIPSIGREETRRYWTPAFRPDPAMTFQSAVDDSRRELLRAVKIRLRSDVPLAFCMSGGIDSNALIGIAKHVFNYDVHGFTVYNHDARYDERHMVEHAVRALGIRHTVVPVDTRDFLPRLRTLIRQHDAPVYTISYFAHWLLMEKIAAQGYRISVSGTGADELFSGYYDHHLMYLAEIHADHALYASAADAWEKNVRPFARNPFLDRADRFVDAPSFREHIYLDAAEFTGYLHQPWCEPFTESVYAPGLLRNRMLNEAFHEAVPVILHEEDLNAMYYSIENRSPFLDRHLFEVCYRIPTPLLVRNGYAKAILREAVRGIVPDKLLDNYRKVGFNAPIASFLDLGNPEVSRYVLADSPIFRLVRRDRMEALVKKGEIRESESKFLFYFVCAKIFLDEMAG